MVQIHIGVDPGYSGALVTIYDGRVIASMCMPVLGEGKKKRVDGRRIIEYIEQSRETVAQSDSMLTFQHDDVVMCVERVQAFPQQGVSSAFNFGRAAGVVQGVAQAYGACYVEVEPKEWQKLIQGKPPAGADAASRKRWIKSNAVAVARDLFPMLTILRKLEYGKADAALIAETVRRTV